MGEIWGRNGRETAVAEWRWGQTIGHIDLYNVYGPCIDGSRPTAGAAEPERGQAETLAVNTHGRLQTASHRPALVC
eukprot:COSAG04_NODE_7455_length_1126_cov_1.212269_2_plen_76_part_00